MSQQISVKFTNIKFHENPCSHPQAATCKCAVGWIDEVILKRAPQTYECVQEHTTTVTAMDVESVKSEQLSLGTES
jgi:hypothetical protein